MPGPSRKFAPFATRPNLNPKVFDPNDQTFIPDRSLDTSKVRKISVRRIQMLGAKVYRSTDQSIVDDGAFHTITFDTQAFDQGDLWSSGAATKLTIPYAGVWTITGFVSFEPDPVPPGAGNRFLKITKNGSTTLVKEVLTNVGSVVSADMPALITDDVFAAGDYVTLDARQGSGGPLKVLGGSTENFFSAMFRGPI